MENVYLSISPRPSGIQYSFGYVLSKKLERRCYIEEMMPDRKWFKKLEKWALYKMMNINNSEQFLRRLFHFLMIMIENLNGGLEKKRGN